MDNFGFIHGELDTKLLILYILRRLPAPVDARVLEQLCLFDGGVSYFDYADCLAHLVETEHVEEPSPGTYAITEKGARNGETAESSLPYSVRTKAENLLAPVAERMRRERMIQAGHEEAEGGTIVRLTLSDGKGQVLSLKLLAADEEQANSMENHFRRNAEEIYGRIAEILLEK